MAETKQIRIPRPSGLTLLARNFQKASTTEEENRLKVDIIKRVVSSYVQNGFTFMGKPANIEDMAFFLKISLSRVMKEISRYSKTLASIASPEETQATLQAMVGLILQNAITDRAKVQKQADMLVNEQQGKYTAFLTKEANSALKNLMDSNKPLLDLMKNLQGGSNINIQNNLNPGQEGEAMAPEESFTVDDAVALLDKKDHGTLFEKEERLAGLISETSSGLDLPEVVATRQKNFELQGNFNAKESVKIKKGSHIDRNENDGEIVDGIEEIAHEEIK